MSSELAITPMTVKDVTFAMELSDHERWNHIPVDFERTILLDPLGSFVAMEGEVKVGMITTSRYGRYGFLGNLIVTPQARGRRVGESLMKHAIAYLQTLGVKTIELDGVLAAVSLYRRLGFRDKYLSVRLFRPPTGEVCRAEQDDLPDTKAALALDKALTGVSRRALLEGLLEDHPGGLMTLGKPVNAYAIVRTRGQGAWRIGPLVAKDWRSAERLFAKVLEKYGGGQVSMGVPEPNYRMIQHAVERGFVYNPLSVRMYLGKRLEYEKHVYAICGPGVG